MRGREEDAEDFDRSDFDSAPCGLVDVATAPRPNIVFIVVDDLGYGGLGYQGDRQALTPNIDALAKSGVRLTNAYANHPVCAPSRAAIMTGRYPQRFGFEFNPKSEVDSADNFGLPRDEPTIAEKLAEVGYATGMFGKWHLGFKSELQPPSRGFDTFYGHLDSASAHGLALVTPSGEITKGSRDMRVRRGFDFAPIPADLTRQLGDETVAFIEANKSRPFFVCTSSKHLGQMGSGFNGGLASSGVDI